MAQVTIHREPGVPVDVIAGSPPADQSGLVAAQVSRIAELESQLLAAFDQRDAAIAAQGAAEQLRDAAQAKIDTVNAAQDAFDAALAGLRT